MDEVWAIFPLASGQGADTVYVRLAAYDQSVGQLFGEALVLTFGVSGIVARLVHSTISF